MYIEIYCTHRMCDYKARRCIHVVVFTCERGGKRGRERGRVYHCSSVIRCGDGVEALLTSCVPYLELYSLPIQIYCLNLKIDAYTHEYEKQGKNMNVCIDACKE